MRADVNHQLVLRARPNGVVTNSRAGIAKKLRLLSIAPFGVPVVSVV